MSAPPQLPGAARKMHFFNVILLSLSLVMTTTKPETKDRTLLEATYTPIEGSDREYGQGAIERNDLAHREIRPNVWVIRVPDDDGPATWTQRLNAAVDSKHGSFRVVEASDEECRGVESGEIAL
ncbi:MAG: hypothetical protein ABI837_09735, partial [Acidobacteriota bacterium]